MLVTAGNMYGRGFPKEYPSTNRLSVWEGAGQNLRANSLIHNLHTKICLFVILQCGLGFTLYSLKISTLDKHAMSMCSEDNALQNWLFLPYITSYSVTIYGIAVNINIPVCDVLGEWPPSLSRHIFAYPTNWIEMCSWFDEYLTQYPAKSCLCCILEVNPYIGMCQCGASFCRYLWLL